MSTDNSDLFKKLMKEYFLNEKYKEDADEIKGIRTLIGKIIRELNDNTITKGAAKNTIQNLLGPPFEELTDNMIAYPTENDAEYYILEFDDNDNLVTKTFSEIWVR